MIEQFTVGDLRVEIDFDRDPDPLNPRKDYENFGHMVCWHSRYVLGDEQPSTDPSEWIDTLIKETRGVVILPLYLYDHGGITMKTSPFSCPWDSGQVGWIYATREHILKEYGGNRLTQKLRKLVSDVLRMEVELYDRYLTGEIYEFTVWDQDEIVAQCSGFDELAYCRSAAIEDAKRYVEDLAA